MENEELLPRDAIGEIVKRVDPATLVDLICVCKWINAMVIPLVSDVSDIVSYGNISACWFREVCKISNLLLIIRLYQSRYKKRELDQLQYQYWHTYHPWSNSNLIDPLLGLEGFRLACMKGHLAVAKYLYKLLGPHLKYTRRIDKSRVVDLLTVGFEMACWKGHIHIAKWLLECGPNNYDRGLYLSCRKGSVELIRLILNHQSISGYFNLNPNYLICAINWNWVLRDVCHRKHAELIGLSIEQGATYCDNCGKSVKDHL